MWILTQIDTVDVVLIKRYIFKQVYNLITKNTCMPFSSGIKVYFDGIDYIY
jgi:hypothetical protein